MSAWADLLRDHHATVYRVALGVLRDPAAAEDVAQDVFLAFLRNPQAVARADSLRAVACRAALHRALDVRKAGLRRAARESAVCERSVAMDPVEAAFRRELRDTVARLPEIHRQAVDLHFFQGLTIAETAQALDVPRGTASRRLSDALATLRRWLSAAAFVAVLAKLESELSRLEAAPVPAGLEKRLRDLPRTHVAGAPELRPLPRAVKGMVAMAVALLLAITTARWIRPAETGDAGEPGEVRAEIAEVQRAATDAAVPPAPEPPGGNPGPGCHNAAAAIPEVEETIEGFLFRTPEGVFLAGEVVPDPGAPGTRTSAGRLWRLSGGGLESWPLPDSTDFSPFLEGGAPASSAPRTRVRLRVRTAAAVQLVLVDQEQQKLPPENVWVWQASSREAAALVAQIDAPPAGTEGSTAVRAYWSVQLSGDALTQDGVVETVRELEFAPGPDIELHEAAARDIVESFRQRVRREEPEAAAATVLDVLEVETLNDAWLEAWRDLFLAAATLLRPDVVDPETRNAAAARLGEALQRARLARAGQSPAAWRVRMEHRFAAAAVPALAAEGLASFLPGMPTAAELREVVLGAAGPDDLRVAVVSRWGEEALLLTVPAALVRTGVPGERVIESADHTLSELVALPPADFQLTVESTRATESVKNW
ncbi:MAG: sigma-70 family RNA polymerase sigma factor [Planctomycetia bacterium]|nr:sigma-70 family RNA polymerase sigma factor [Planctomycetia bacterium]